MSKKGKGYGYHRSKEAGNIGRISRRDFFKWGGLAALGATGTAGAIAAVDHFLNDEPEDQLITLPETAGTNPAIIVDTIPEGPRIKEDYQVEDLRDISRQASNNYNRYLDRDVDSDEFAESIFIVDTIAEFQTILPDFQDASTTHAVTTEDNKVMINRESLDETMRFLPDNDLGDRARANVFEEILIHELAHRDSTKYKSDALHNFVWRKMFAEVPTLEGKEIRQGVVTGAEVKATVIEPEGERSISSFEVLEEVEVEIITNYVLDKSGRQDLSQRIPSYSSESRALLTHMLSAMGGDVENNIKTLTRLRAKVGGREEWATIIGESFGEKPEDHLEFSMSLLFAIDSGNVGYYEHLISRE